MIIIDGRLIAKNIRGVLKKEVGELNRPPVLAVILVGQDPASELYTRIKEKAAMEIGIKFVKYTLPENATEQQLSDLIIKLNNDSNTNAIVIQLPLPLQIDTSKIISLIKPHKDADALNEKTKITPPTVGAIMEIFSHYRISLKDKNIVIVGHGKLVGKPLSMYFDKHGIKYEICDKNTANLAEKTLRADVIIAGTGSPHLIKKNMVKKNVVIIDAGTAVEKTSDNKSKVLGDVDFENVQLIASYITPPTGGVGPITVAKLLENVVALAKKND